MTYDAPCDVCGHPDAKWSASANGDRVIACRGCDEAGIPITPATPLTDTRLAHAIRRAV